MAGFTLSDLLQQVYLDLGQLTVSTATGGSTTTIVDSKLTNFFSDDEWGGKPGEDGSAFIIEDSAGAGAAPEGEFSRVSDYVDSSGTFTLRTTLSAAVASGDRYGVANNFFPLDDMIEVANRALSKLGPVTLVDNSTVSAAAKTEYSVGVDLKREPPVRIEYQGKTGDSNDNEWIEIRDFDWAPASPGSAATLEIPQIPSGRTINIWYMAEHPRVSSSSDNIYEPIEPDLAVVATVERALAWQNTRLQGDNDFLVQRWNDAKVDLEEALAKWDTHRPSKKEALVIPWGPRRDVDNLKTPGT